jgi:hypothetical protein
MNRRDLFKRLTGGLAAAGVTGVSVDAVVAPTSPGEVLAVIRCQRLLSHEGRAHITTAWKQATKDTAFEGVKAIVLDPTIELEIVRR